MTKALYTFLCFLLYSVLGAALAFVWANASHINAADGAPVQTPSAVIIGVSQLVSLIVTACLLWALKLIRRRPLQSGLRLGGKVWVTSIVGFLLLSVGLSVLVAPLELSDNGQMALFDAMKGNVACLFMLTVAGPLFEELVFREGILRHFLNAWQRPVLAALASALLFAIVHVNAAQALPAALLGFVLGLFYLRTGDIRLCGPLHILNNSVAVLLLAFPSIEAAIMSWPLLLQLGIGAAMFIAGAALTVVVCRPVFRCQG